MSPPPLPPLTTTATPREHAVARPGVRQRHALGLHPGTPPVPAPTAPALEQPTQLGDAPIRAALRARLARHLQRGDAVLLEELGLCRGQVRADVTLVNGALHAYEIKSDRDTLHRLLPQAAMYAKIFDRVTLVVGARHQAAALALIPPWWGVLAALPTPRGPRLHTVRRALRNRAIDPRALVELLWLDDALALLERRGAVRGARGKPRAFVWDRVCEQYAVNEIAAAVRGHLKARATQRAVPRPS